MLNKQIGPKGEEFYLRYLSLSTHLSSFYLYWYCTLTSTVISICSSKCIKGSRRTTDILHKVLNPWSGLEQPLKLPSCFFFFLDIATCFGQKNIDKHNTTTTTMTSRRQMSKTYKRTIESKAEPGASDSGQFEPSQMLWINALNSKGARELMSE